MSRSVNPQPPKTEFLWYIPNTVEPGHRGDNGTVDDGYGTLDYQVDLARRVEDHGWAGALLGTSWGRPDTFTVAASITARTTTFNPLIAIRPGYWRPAHFASAAATLDQLSGGRVRVNIVSGQDNLHQYGDVEGDQAERYARTKEFMRLVRRLWTEENVTFKGEHFSVEESTVSPRPVVRGDRIHPRLYFGGASEPAERVSATESDVQLFWGEPLDGVAERIARLKGLEQSLERDLPPLEFGLRITTLVRDTTEEAWHDAEAKVAKMAAQAADDTFRKKFQRSGFKATGQQRLLDLAEQGRRARHLPLHRTRQVRRRRGRHHLAGRLGRGRRPRPAQVPGARHHPLRALRHAVQDRDRPGRRQRCCRCCGRRRWSPRPA